VLVDHQHQATCRPSALPTRHRPREEVLVPEDSPDLPVAHSLAGAEEMPAGYSIVALAEAARCSPFLAGMAAASPSAVGIVEEVVDLSD
jgi:hypothetical protein